MVPKYVIFLLSSSGNVTKEEYYYEPDIRVNYLRQANRDNLTKNSISGFIYFENVDGVWEQKEVRFDTRESRILLNLYKQKFLREAR